VALFRRSRRLGVGVVAVMIAVTAIGVPAKVRDKTDTTARSYRRIHTLVTSAHLDHAVVVLPPRSRYVLAPYPFLANRPDLSGRIVYAVDDGADDLGLGRRFPDRTLYRFERRYLPGGPLLHPATDVIGRWRV